MSNLSFGDIGVPSILTIAGLIWIGLGVFGNVPYWGWGIVLTIIGIILFIVFGSHNKK